MILKSNRSSIDWFHDADADDAVINNWSMFPNGENTMSFPYSPIKMAQSVCRLIMHSDLFRVQFVMLNLDRVPNRLRLNLFIKKTKYHPFSVFAVEVYRVIFRVNEQWRMDWDAIEWNGGEEMMNF